MAGAPAGFERGPAVLAIGGLLTSPWIYLGMKRALLARGASRVALAPLFGLHWLASAFIGLGPATSIVARAINRLSDEDGGRPIVVVGHSGGGTVARLALATRPFDGARRARPGAVGALVTLGTPHLATRVDGTLGRQGMRALRFLARYGSPPGASGVPGERAMPAGTWAPPVLTVGSTFSEDFSASGGPAWVLPRLRAALARACYVALLGAPGHRARGDGMVPLACAHLPAAEQVTLSGFAHGPVLWGRRWYGADAGIAQWWDHAVRLWSAAAERGPTIGP